MTPPQEQGKLISRRNFLITAFEATAASALAACGMQPPASERVTQVAPAAQAATSVATVSAQQTEQPKPTDEEPIATPATVPAEIQKMVDENPDIQAAIAGSEWDSEASGYVKKDANGEITDWYDVDKAHWVRVTQIKRVPDAEGNIVDVYIGTSLTEEQLQLWERLGILGPAPRNPGFLESFPQVGNMDPFFAGLWGNALKAKGVGEATPLKWRSFDKQGNMQERQNTITSRKLFINFCMGPDGFEPLVNPVKQLNENGWTPVVFWADAENKKFDLGLAMRTGAQGDRLVLDMFLVTIDESSRDFGSMDTNLILRAMAVAAEELRMGRVFSNLDEVNAYQKDHDLLKEGEGYALKTDKFPSGVSPTMVLDVTK